MMRSAVLCAALMSLLLPAAALAQGAPGADAPIILGVAAPLSGSHDILGQQVLAGATAAAEAAGGNAPVTIDEADTACSAEGGARAARDLAERGASVAVGFLCTEALEAALPILTEASIPALVAGVRAGRFTEERERTGHLVWRVAPRSDAQADAVAAAIQERWQGQPFGLIDDGSIAGRGLADAVRGRLEAEGMVPSAIDNYRPAEEKQFGLVRRLERTGVTRFFIAGDRPDVAIIARDAAEAGLDLSLIGGEELFDEYDAELPLPPGILAVAPVNRFESLSPQDAAENVSPAEADPTLYDGRQGYYGPSLAAAQIAIEAIRASRAGNRPLPDVLNSAEFATALGPVRFDADGNADLDLYRVFEWRDGRFVEPASG